MGLGDQVRGYLAQGDGEAADRTRYAAYCLDEACALVALRVETRAATAPAEQQGGTMKAGIISGRIPYKPDDCPAWIDEQFPEGVVTQMVKPSDAITGE